MMTCIVKIPKACFVCKRHSLRRAHYTNSSRERIMRSHACTLQGKCQTHEMGQKYIQRMLELRAWQKKRDVRSAQHQTPLSPELLQRVFPAMQ